VIVKCGATARGDAEEHPMQSALFVLVTVVLTIVTVRLIESGDKPRRR
jgi:hypothetical protein